MTHDQDEALTMSDRVIVMNHGRIVQDGTPTEVYQKPTSVFAARFIGEAVLFRGRVARLDGAWCAVESDGVLLQGPARSGLQTGEAIVVCVRPERLRIGPSPTPRWTTGWRGRS